MPGDTMTFKEPKETEGIAFSTTAIIPKAPILIPVKPSPLRRTITTINKDNLERLQYE
jgi:hypothetical protein